MLYLTDPWYTRETTENGAYAKNCTMFSYTRKVFISTSAERTTVDTDLLGEQAQFPRWSKARARQADDLTELSVGVSAEWAVFLKCPAAFYPKPASRGGGGVTGRNKVTTLDYL